MIACGAKICDQLDGRPQMLGSNFSTKKKKMLGSNIACKG